jgi:hypothetical protein
VSSPKMINIQFNSLNPIDLSISLLYNPLIHFHHKANINISPTTNFPNLFNS